MLKRKKILNNNKLRNFNKFFLIKNFSFKETSKKKNIQYLTQKFVNFLMIDGKKEKAEQTFLHFLKIVKIKEKKEGILILLKAVKNVKPTLGVRSIRRGGATYQLPIPLRQNRSISFALKWMIETAKKRKGSFVYNLAQNVIESSKNLGENIKKRESLETTALKNRSFASFFRF